MHQVPDTDHIFSHLHPSHLRMHLWVLLHDKLEQRRLYLLSDNRCRALTQLLANQYDGVLHLNSTNAWIWV